MNEWHHGIIFGLLHMALQVARSGKGLGTQRTFVGFGLLERLNATLLVNIYLDVCHLVVVKVGASSEALATGITLVWLLACVDSSVSIQGGAGGESFLTNVTHMRSLPGMDSNVSLQKAWTVKYLSTVVAR